MLSCTAWVAEQLRFLRLRFCTYFCGSLEGGTIPFNLM